MARPGTMIISPSGNLYGSELVLLDYLNSTSLRSDVAVPAGSPFYQKLTMLAVRHQIRPYKASRLKNFYAGLLLKLIANQYGSVYLNEAGHVKYILLLSKLFPKKKFIVHVRLFEDTARNRWFLKPGDNVTIISISNYIAQLLPYPSTVLYDAFTFHDVPATTKKVQEDKLSIGVIGRITLTKGLGRLADLLKLMKERGVAKHYRILLYGATSEDAVQAGFINRLQEFDNVVMCGFEPSTEKIYGAIDCVMHFSTQEALGRTFLEAIDHGKPFIGMRAAGIGEISGLLSMQEWVADAGAADLPEQLLTMLEKIRTNYNQVAETVALRKPLAVKIFDRKQYAVALDKLLSV
mgnify:CR=1 FL=1